MKRNYFILLQIVIISLIIMPFKVNATTVDMSCSYSINIDEKNTILNYKITSNRDVILSFDDGTDILNNSINWYHDSDFKNEFLKSATINNNLFTCPTLMLEKSNKIISIYARLYNIKSCDGACTKLEAKRVNSSKEQQVSLITDSEIINTNDIDLYFRILKNNNKQWSIDGINYTSTNNSIENIKLSKKIIKNIFKNNKIATIDKAYICDNNNVVTDSSQCISDNTKMLGVSINNILGNTQKSYKKSPKMKCTGSKDSLLGDPNDEDSVAWLIQKVLNWLKIIGPVIVIIFSSIDYLRALIQSDEETMTKLNKKLITRIVLVLLLFFVPTLVNAVLALFNLTNSQTCNLE